MSTVKNKAIPIVFIHKGNSFYLPYTFSQVKATNPDSPIYLIGTPETKHFESLLTQVDIGNYFQEAKSFASIYKHFSTNGYEFELICLQRWFVLKEFMIDRNIESCIFLDSDILVYSDLSVERNHVSEYAMTILGISPHTNFVNSRDTLVDFCSYIMDFYSTRNSFEILHNKHQNFLKKHRAGGISDMTFFLDFKEKNPEKIGDISVIKNNSTFDVTLDTNNGYEMEDGIKKIIWKNNQPYCLHLASGELVKFHTLHFQGKTKKYISGFVKTKGLNFYTTFLFFRAKYFFGKVKSKLKKWRIIKH